MPDFAFVFAGFVVGLVVGLTGVGGGSLMTPLLIFAFGVKPHLAIGTDLLFAAFTKLGGTVNLARAKVVDWKVVGKMALGSIPAALATLYLLQRLRDEAHRQQDPGPVDLQRPDLHPPRTPIRQQSSPRMFNNTRTTGYFTYVI